MQNAAISIKVPNEGEDKQEAAARFDFHAARVAILSEFNRIKRRPVSVRDGRSFASTFLIVLSSDRQAQQTFYLQHFIFFLCI